MRFIAPVVLLLLTSFYSTAQVDTINTDNLKLNIKALKEGKSSFAVYFEDSAGNRLTSADIWDRSIQFTKDEEGNSLYNFSWNWYRKDTLIAAVTAKGLMPSLKPINHNADYKRRGQFAYAFAKDVVTIPGNHQKTAKDSSFNVKLDPPAFEFPMDLEIFPLLPFRKTGQEFAIAFYEPGGAKSNYYHLTVTGKEDLPLVGGEKVNCWMLRIDYAPKSYATFWITDKTREVVKMKEYFNGRYRYKVRLY